VRVRQAFPELRGCALIRELHVYGVMQCVGARVASTIAPGGTNEATADTQPSQAPKQLSQHGGFGRQLMQRAEQVAISAGFRKIAVISGVGVRNYYRRLGVYALCVSCTPEWC
jgi:histone acetyltransferase (RNA polymerase elongator complex component)